MHTTQIAHSMEVIEGRLACERVITVQSYFADFPGKSIVATRNQWPK
jgi:hypothetical protein